MIRQALSLLLVSILTVPANPVSALEVATKPTLEERLGNMDAEVERFIRLKTAGSRGPILEQETPATDESSEAERVRAILLSLESGTEIAVVLRDGEIVQGQLVEVTDDAFWLRYEIEERHHRRKKYGFDQVESLEFSGLREKVYEIPVGKRVEVVLLNGEKVRGKSLDATEPGFTLSTGKDVSREFTFDEVTSVRKLGMRTVYKVLIISGVSFAILVGLVAAAYAGV